MEKDELITGDGTLTLGEEEEATDGSSLICFSQGKFSFCCTRDDVPYLKATINEAYRIGLEVGAERAEREIRRIAKIINGR